MDERTRGNADEGSREKHRHRGKFTEGLLDNELIIRTLALAPGQAVLDAGCGNGYMAKLFSREVEGEGRVFALDPDAQAIDILAEETRGGNITAVRGDITRPTPIEAASLDLIYLSTVIHAFSNEKIRGFREETLRILKPGARLAVVEIEKKPTNFGPPMNLRFSPQELARALDLPVLETVRAGQHFYLELFSRP